MREIRCSVCQAANRRDASYCHACGTSLTMSPTLQLQSGAAWQARYGQDCLIVYEASRIQQSIETRIGFYAVVDGVSAAAAGAAAARVVEQVLRQQVASLVDPVPLTADPAAEMVTILRFANRALLTRQQKRDESGTAAVTAALVRDRTATVVSAGHVRAYLFRNDFLRQITVDHTIASGLEARGYISPAAVETHPRRNQLYSHLGMPNVTIDTFTEELQHGDRLVLCSNGIWDVVPAQTLASIVADEAPQSACDRLAELARNGDVDDATAIVVHVTAVSQETQETL